MADRSAPDIAENIEHWPLKIWFGGIDIGKRTADNPSFSPIGQQTRQPGYPKAVRVARLQTFVRAASVMRCSHFSQYSHRITFSEISQTSVAATYGAFRLEREDCVEQQPRVAVLHYASCVAKVGLIWSSADGKVSILYEDNGNLLTRSYRYPIRANLPETCELGGSYTALPSAAGQRRGLAKSGGRRPFGTTLARCSRGQAGAN